jgi:hypothetical protein
MGSRSEAIQRVRHFTLSRLEEVFASYLPSSQLFPTTASGPNSRECIYSSDLTFHCMLWQRFHPEASGREVVRQLQASLSLQGGPSIDDGDSAYCQAKARIPIAPFHRAIKASALRAEQFASRQGPLQQRSIKAIDGTSLTLPDQPANRLAYPPVQCPPDSPSFPIMRAVALSELSTGAIDAVNEGSQKVSELALGHGLIKDLKSGDILVGDRAYGCFPFIGCLQRQGVDFIGRCSRNIDGRRRISRLGPGDFQVCWTKGKTPSPWLSQEQWEALPERMNLRVIRTSIPTEGSRIKSVTIITTLLDAEAYPAAEILEAFRRRWRLEMCFDDVKTSMKMETLRGRTPDMVRKELYAGVIAHNLIRCTMMESAWTHEVPVERISFKGSLDTLRQTSQAMAAARSGKKREELWMELLATLANDQVRDRPGRREPRAVKRTYNKYPRLNVPRRKFRDHPKRNARRKSARLRAVSTV